MKDDTVSVTHRMTLIVIMPRRNGIIILSVTWVVLDSELPRCLLYGIQFTFVHCTLYVCR